MYKNKSVAVVIPAFNEEKLIGKTLMGIPDFVDLIVVINDCSTDQTEAEIEKYKEKLPQLKTVTNEVNKGCGGSIWQGYEVCADEGSDIFVVMAGDGQMDPSDLPNLLDPIVEGRSEYCKGNRLQNSGVTRHMPLYRFFGNAVLTVLTKFATGYWHAVDPQCGYTAIKSSAYKKVNKENIHAGYGYNADILQRLNLINCRLAEVSVRAIYGEAKSTINIFHYIPTVSRLLMSLFFRRMGAKYLWSFHPIMLYYLLGALLFAGGAFGGLYVLLVDFMTLSGIGFGWMLLGAIMIITGIQLLLSGIWLDMDDNKIFNANENLFKDVT